jgi:hypothetical protein
VVVQRGRIRRRRRRRVVCQGGKRTRPLVLQQRALWRSCTCTIYHCHLPTMRMRTLWLAVCIGNPAPTLHAVRRLARTSCCMTDSGRRGSPLRGCTCTGAAAIPAMTTDKQGGGCCAISHAISIQHERICTDNEYNMQYCLVATTVRGGDQGGSGGGNCNNDAVAQPNACIAIIDLALEKVLSAHAHVRKGSTI